MRPFMYAGLLGLIGGLLFAPKKGSELRHDIEIKTSHIVDTLFCSLATISEAPLPRHAKPLQSFAPEDNNEEKLAAEAMNRIKVALDA